MLPPGGSVTDSRQRLPVSGRRQRAWLWQPARSISASQGHRGAWEATAPAGLEIVGRRCPGRSPIPQPQQRQAIGVAASTGRRRPELPTNTMARRHPGRGSLPRTSGFRSSAAPTHAKAGTTANVAALSVNRSSLSVRETTGPSLTAPNGLWQTHGWVRGQWPLNFSGSSPSGMCGLNGTVNQIPITGTTSPRDVATWQQCSAPAVSDTINTASYGQGAMPLYIAGYDAAGETISYTQDDLCRQQHADAVAQRPDGRADHGGHPVRDRAARAAARQGSTGSRARSTAARPLVSGRERAGPGQRPR